MCHRKRAGGPIGVGNLVFLGNLVIRCWKLLWRIYSLIGKGEYETEDKGA
jgi:hypothetical protein